MLIGGEAPEGLQTPGEIVGVDEGLQMSAELLVTPVMIPFDGRLFDRPVHPFDLTVRPRMVRLGEAMLDAVLPADLVEPMNSVARRPAVTIAGKVGELDAVIRKDGVQPVWDGFDQSFQKRHGGRPVGLVVQLGKSELRRAIDRYEQVELSLFGAHLGDVDMKEADRIGLELLLRPLVALDVRKARDVMALEQSMQT